MENNWDSTDVEGYTGPWGKYVDEQQVARPDEDLLKVCDQSIIALNKSINDSGNGRVQVEAQKVHKGDQGRGDDRDEHAA